MKGYERRAAGKPNYWKLAWWNDRVQCWQDGKRQYDMPEAAKADAKRPGRYRLSQVIDGRGRIDGEEFIV